MKIRNICLALLVPALLLTAFVPTTSANEFGTGHLGQNRGYLLGNEPNPCLYGDEFGNPYTPYYNYVPLYGPTSLKFNRSGAQGNVVTAVLDLRSLAACVIDTGGGSLYVLPWLYTGLTTFGSTAFFSGSYTAITSANVGSAIYTSPPRTYAVPGIYTVDGIFDLSSGDGAAGEMYASDFNTWNVGATQPPYETWGAFKLHFMKSDVYSVSGPVAVAPGSNNTYTANFVWDGAGAGTARYRFELRGGPASANEHTAWQNESHFVGSKPISAQISFGAGLPVGTYQVCAVGQMQTSSDMVPGLAQDNPTTVTDEVCMNVDVSNNPPTETVFDFTIDGDSDGPVYKQLGQTALNEWETTYTGCRASLDGPALVSGWADGSAKDDNGEQTIGTFTAVGPYDVGLTCNPSKTIQVIVSDSAPQTTLNVYSTGVNNAGITSTTVAPFDTPEIITSANAISTTLTAQPTAGASQAFINWTGCANYTSGTTCNVSVAQGGTGTVTAHYASTEPGYAEVWVTSSLSQASWTIHKNGVPYTTGIGSNGGWPVLVSVPAGGASISITAGSISPYGQPLITNYPQGSGNLVQLAPGGQSTFNLAYNMPGATVTISGPTNVTTGAIETYTATVVSNNTANLPALQGQWSPVSGSQTGQVSLAGGATSRQSTHPVTFHSYLGSPVQVCFQVSGWFSNGYQTANDCETVTVEPPPVDMTFTLANTNSISVTKGSSYVDVVKTITKTHTGGSPGPVNLVLNSVLPSGISVYSISKQGNIVSSGSPQTSDVTFRVSPSATPSAAGHWITMRGINSNGTVGVNLSFRLIVNNAPVAPDDLDVVCRVQDSDTVTVNTPVTWIAEVSGGSGNYTYVWTGSAGLSSTATSPTITYSTIGTKHATVEVTDTSTSATGTCASDPGEVTVTVDPNFEEF